VGRCLVHGGRAIKYLVVNSVADYRTIKIYPQIPQTSQFFKDNSPFSVDGSVTRVEVSSVIPQGGETYQVSWVETKTKPGATAEAEHWKAVVTVGIDAKLAENPKVALWNPFGIYVKSISWTKEVL